MLRSRSPSKFCGARMLSNTQLHNQFLPTFRIFKFNKEYTMFVFGKNTYVVYANTTVLSTVAKTPCRTFSSDVAHVDKHALIKVR